MSLDDDDNGTYNLDDENNDDDNDLDDNDNVEDDDDVDDDDDKMMRTTILKGHSKSWLLDMALSANVLPKKARG